MNVYIAASSPYKAFGLATILQKKVKGIRVVSTWHDLLKKEANPEVKLRLDEEKSDRADDNLADLQTANVLVLMDDYDSVPGGKHFELGYAFAKDTKTVVLGRREHLYTRHESVVNATTLQELIGILKQLKTDL